MSATLDLGDVSLVAPGAVYIPAERALVIADPHAGYVSTLRSRGHALPAVGDGELHARLRGLLSQAEVATVVVAGDLVHGPAAITDGSLDAFIDALGAVSLVVVPGNHDRGVHRPLLARGVTVSEGWSVGPHAVRHGDEPAEALRGLRDEARARGGRLVIGHVHPALSVSDGRGARARVPAFAWGEGFVALPAMAPLARGADLRRADHAAAITEVVPAAECETAVVVGAEVIRTGRLDRVRRAG